MDEQTLARYIELKDIIKQNNDEMKPLKKELKEIEQEIIESGQTNFSYYGVNIIVEPKETEKMVKEEVEALISKEIRSNNGDGLGYNDFYERTMSKKVKIVSPKKKKDLDINDL